LALGGRALRIGGIVDVSTVDWYGNVAFMVFAAGCNFRCPYCQNSTLIPSDSGQEVGLDFIEERIKTNFLLIDTLGVTGGEPTLQPMVLREVYGLARKLRLKTLLDTNGSRPDVIRKLLSEDLVDHVALDVKAPLKSEDYSRIIGVKNCDKIVEDVMKSLDLCVECGVSLEIRTTVVPGLSDGEEFITEIARAIKGKYRLFFLQQFNPLGNILDPKLKERGFMSRQRLLDLASLAAGEGLKEIYIKTHEKGLEKVG